MGFAKSVAQRLGPKGAQKPVRVGRIGRDQVHHAKAAWVVECHPGATLKMQHHMVMLFRRRVIVDKGAKRVARHHHPARHAKMDQQRLAAIQIGIPRRMLVIDCSGEEEENNPIVFINPEIVDSSDDRSTYEEGCLSIPDYYAEVERPAEVTVSYIDRDGAPQEIRASGLLATCVQHEIDHLNGVLFIDHISKLKRDMVVRKFTKLAKSRGTTAL